MAKGVCINPLCPPIIRTKKDITGAFLPTMLVALSISGRIEPIADEAVKSAISVVESKSVAPTTSPLAIPKPKCTFPCIDYSFQKKYRRTKCSPIFQLIKWQLSVRSIGERCKASSRHICARSSSLILS